MNQFDFVKLFNYDIIPYQPRLYNFKKQHTENINLYKRNLPVDNIKKHTVLDFRPINTSLGLQEKYRKQVIDTPSTETLRTNKKLDFSYCHQKFNNVDDESFLFNINKVATKGKEFNINKKIINYPEDYSDNPFRNTYLNGSEDVFDNSCPQGSTKRKIIIDPELQHNPDQKWCYINNSEDLLTDKLFSETNEPSVYIGHEYSTIKP